MKTPKSSPSNYNDLEPAPLRFTAAENLEDPWQGSPSIPYGIIRHLAFTERQKNKKPYLRILFGEGGRRGDPWGGLNIEINGHVHHFGAGMAKHTHLHNGKGGLTDEGLQIIANGLPGELSFDQTDWRWIQDELDISCMLSEASIVRIETQFQLLQSGAIPLPTFQSKAWAKKIGEPKKNFHNCTTIIATALNKELETPLTQDMPLPLFNALKAMKKTAKNNLATELDKDLNKLLWLSEEELNELFTQVVPPQVDMNTIAKGLKQIPEELNWEEILKNTNK